MNLMEKIALQTRMFYQLLKTLLILTYCFLRINLTILLTDIGTQIPILTVKNVWALKIWLMSFILMQTLKQFYEIQ